MRPARVGQGVGAFDYGEGAALMKRIFEVGAASVAAAALGVLCLGGSGAPARASANLLIGPSPMVGFHTYLSNPKLAPESLRTTFSAARRALARREVAAAASPRGQGKVFNGDTVGLPQNEESISSCRTKPRTVLGGTNDYRYLLDPEGNSTGWHFSTDGGRTLTNEGLLPALTAPDGATVLPSGGDPVDVAGGGCSLYAADLNYDFTQPFPFPSGVGVYRSDPSTLSTCPQGESAGGLTHPECWPTRRLVDFAAPGHFLDKEWMDVGRSGSAGEVVWIAYGDLSAFNAEGNEESGVIKAVRCSADLSACTAPIVLSEGQTVAEYPDVTIGPDGRTYITWGEFFGDSFIGPTQQSWIAVAEPGSTTFTRYPIYREDQVMRGHETLHAADFRTGTMFKNTVTMVHGHPRVLVTWERCLLHAADQVCEEPQIALTSSNDLGRTWSQQRVVSAGGDNYFPEIDTDPKSGAIFEAWYTHRFDPIFHNRQDVELARLAPNGAVLSRRRVTKISNETEADPILHGLFIGDYFEVDANAGRVYVHFNANARQVPLLGEGVPIPQQDNYLSVLFPE
jgi:hypothetical protein